MLPDPDDLYEYVAAHFPLHEMSMKPSLWNTNQDDYLHAKREFGNTKDKDHVVNSM